MAYTDETTGRSAASILPSSVTTVLQNAWSTIKAQLPTIVAKATMIPGLATIWNYVKGLTTGEVKENQIINVPASEVVMLLQETEKYLKTAARNISRIRPTNPEYAELVSDLEKHTSMYKMLRNALAPAFKKIGYEIPTSDLGAVPIVGLILAITAAIVAIAVSMSQYAKIIAVKSGQVLQKQNIPTYLMLGGAGVAGYYIYKNYLD